jgi:pimeloyl-ACP methyl ester carboxylesterase
MDSPFSFVYHSVDVPEDWNNPDQTIEIVVREIQDPTGVKKPPVLFFQGGPGLGCRFPVDQKWIKELQKRFRVILMDQRGTGLSHPIDLEAIAKHDAVSHQNAIDFLSLYRADSIAQDAEHIRQKLFADEPFHTFGQSFGGWCTYSYLSRFPRSAESSLITGGFPPIGHDPKDVYRSIIPQFDTATDEFLTKYPDTHEQLLYLIKELDNTSMLALSQFGINVGFSDEHSSLRSIIEQMYFEINQLGRLTRRTQDTLRDPLGFINNPLYLFLHESLYCEDNASQWAGETVFINEDHRPRKDNLTKFFLAETLMHNYLDMEELKPFSGLMETIMDYDRWPQQFLGENFSEVSTKVAGIIYNNDAYVSSNYSEESAAMLPYCTAIKSDLDHHGMRTEPDKTFGGLFRALDEFNQ